MEKILCFDLDDTLIDDNYKFEITFCECIKAIINSLETRSPQIDDILKRAREIENRTWDTWPKERLYKPERIANAWVKTYESYAKELKLPIRKHTKNLIESLVLSNYDPPYFIIPGVIETISYLKQKGYRTYVVTLGQSKIQRRKLTVTKLIKYFDDAFYATHDKRIPLAEIKKRHPSDDIYMIGNSIRTDINPALDLNLKAIYIERGNWHRFKATPRNNDFTTLENITELATLF